MRKNVEGSTSVLGSLQPRYLSDLGTEPYQEFLTLILKPRIAFLYVCFHLLTLGLGIRGLNLELFIWFGF